jgi:hypothetical protein
MRKKINELLCTLALKKFQVILVAGGSYVSVSSYEH